ncbi:MAG: Gldg family protein [Clostridia bacterium]|nr:Gldg family protein [Clostridia bacterium]
MNMFKKKEQAENATPKKLRNKSAFKHGGYALGMTAIVIALAVAINAFFSFLSERVNLDIDISLSQTNTLSQENKDFLSKIDTEVKITVFCPKEDFITALEYVGNNFYNASDKTALVDKEYDYHTQTLTLLEQYPLCSSKISLNFINPYDPSSTEIAKEYSGVSVCDIIVEGVHNIDGQEIKRSNIISFDDIYYLSDKSGYVAYGDTYAISGSNLETSLTGAIYNVTTAETKQVLVVGSHCTPDSVKDYQSLLEVNGFEFLTQEGSVISELSNETDVLIISAPTEDFMIEELELIDEWLYNSGKRGKALLFFGSIYSPSIPNLQKYLEEWGIALDNGVLFETNERNHAVGDPTTMMFVAAESETEDEGEKKLVQTMRESISNYIVSGGNLPIYQIFEQDGLRSTHNIAVSKGASIVKAPTGTSKDWKPDSSYETSQYASIIVASEDDYVDNVLCSSYVMAFSSFDFLSTSWINYNTYNAKPLVSMSNLISGSENNGFSVTMKTVNSESFDELITDNSGTVLGVIFQITLPILLIALGIVVFIRRSRR